MPMLESTERIHEPGGITPEELAAEFVAREAAGEPVTRSDYRARLATEAERDEFESLLDAAGAAERRLPRAITGGTVLAERYRIVEPIGSGGMGRVFSAIDERLHCKVAVKVLDPLAQGNREREELFRKESRILADLRHPGIVAVHDAGRDGPYTYIVMDLVEGTSLADVLDRARSALVLGTKRERLPRRDGAMLTRAIGHRTPSGRPNLIDPEDWYRSCARILLEITRTIEAAHDRKILHRDLKPANVMLLGGGNPVVLDFGLAGSPDLTTGGVTESLYGSVCYLAPEQARDQRVGMDPRTDVYQLGLVLYEMLTLRRAFPGTAIGDVLRRIEAGFYEAPRRVDPRVPRDLEAICARALELSPGNRYGNARALREDLDRWLEGRAPLAARTASWRSLVRTVRYTGRRHPVLSAAAAVVVVGASVAAWSWGRGAEGWVSLRPFRYDPKNGAVTLLQDRGSMVHPGEWLGVNIDGQEATYLYAISLFGPPDEEPRVVPWPVVSPDDLDRASRRDEPWGLYAAARGSGEGGNFLCTEVQSSAEPGNVEGMIVLASTIERPEIEAWMNQLKLAPDGMLFSEARAALGHEITSVPRGVTPYQKTFSEEQKARIREALSRPAGRSGPSLGLPGIAECSVECRVARK